MKKLAFLFPGQGSQSVGMLDGFATNSAAQDVIARANRALGFDIGALIAQGPAEELNKTVNTQPAMLTASMAAFVAWQDATDVKPVVMAGHSLGEYSALCAAGAMSLRAAVRCVRFRAQAMQRAVPMGVGGMAAIIGLADEQVEAACVVGRTHGLVQAVNFNSPGQVVIAGENAALDAAIEHAKTLGCRRAMRLPVSAPFHSRLLKPAAEKLASYLARMRILRPTIPVYANVDANYHGSPDQIRVKLALQAASAVQWVKIIEAMQAQGVTHAVECGPGKVLAGLVRRIAPGIQVLNVFDQTTLRAAIRQWNQAE